MTYRLNFSPRKEEKGKKDGEGKKLCGITWVFSFVSFYLDNFFTTRIF